jgi:hypothetical protein
MLLNSGATENQEGQKTGLIYAQDRYPPTNKIDDLIYYKQGVANSVDNHLQRMVFSSVSDGRHYLVKLSELHEQKPEFPHEWVVVSRTALVLLTNPHEAEPGEHVMWESLHSENAEMVGNSRIRTKPTGVLPAREFVACQLGGSARCWERV